MSKRYARWVLAGCLALAMSVQACGWMGGDAAAGDNRKRSPDVETDAGSKPDIRSTRDANIDSANRETDETEAEPEPVDCEVASADQCVRGRLEPPGGTAPENYVVKNRYGESAVDRSGYFSIKLAEDRVTYLVASPEGEPAANSLIRIVPGTTDRSELSVTPRSTANALVLLAPDLLTPSPEQTRNLLELTDQAPAVTDLADIVRQHWGESTNPFESEKVKAAYQKAHRAVRSRANATGAYANLPGMQTMAETFSDPSSKTRLSPGLWSQLAVEAPELGSDAKLEVNTRGGRPLSSLVQVRRLDPYGLHRKLRCEWDGLSPNCKKSNSLELYSLGHALDQHEVIRNIQMPDEFGLLPLFTAASGSLEPKTPADHQLWAPGKSYYNTFDIGYWIGKAVPSITPAGNKASIETDKPGLYAVRGLTGVYSPDNTPEGAFAWNKFSDASTHPLVANAVVGIIDLAMAIVGGPDEALKSCGASIAETAAKNAPKIPLRKTDLQSFAAAHVPTLVNCAVSSGLDAVVESLWQQINVVGRIAKGMRGAERLFALLGASVSTQRAIESWLFAVGNPFAPRITSIGGKPLDETNHAKPPTVRIPASKADEGIEISATGRNLCSPSDLGETRFAWRDENGQWSHTEIIEKPTNCSEDTQTVKLELPDSVGGRVKLYAEHVGGRTLTEWARERIPRVDGFSPEGVYAGEAKVGVNSTAIRFVSETQAHLDDCGSRLFESRGFPCETLLLTIRGKGFAPQRHKFVLEAGNVGDAKTLDVDQEASSNSKLVASVDTDTLTNLGASDLAGGYQGYVRWREQQTVPEPDPASGADDEDVVGITVLGPPSIDEYSWPGSNTAGARRNIAVSISGRGFGYEPVLERWKLQFEDGCEATIASHRGNQFHVLANRLTNWPYDASSFIKLFVSEYYFDANCPGADLVPGDTISFKVTTPVGTASKETTYEGRKQPDLFRTLDRMGPDRFSSNLPDKQKTLLEQEGITGAKPLQKQLFAFANGTSQPHHQFTWVTTENSCCLCPPTHTEYPPENDPDYVSCEEACNFDYWPWSGIVSEPPDRGGVAQCLSSTEQGPDYTWNGKASPQIRDSIDGCFGAGFGDQEYKELSENRTLSGTWIDRYCDYLEEGGLRVTGKEMTLDLHIDETKGDSSDGSEPLLEIDGAEGVNLKLTAQSDDCKTGLLIENSERIEIADLEVQGCDTALKIRNSSSVRVRRGELSDFTTGVDITSGSKNIVIGSDTSRDVVVGANVLTEQSNRFETFSDQKTGIQVAGGASQINVGATAVSTDTAALIADATGVEISLISGANPVYHGSDAALKPFPVPEALKNKRGVQIGASGSPEQITVRDSAFLNNTRSILLKSGTDITVTNNAIGLLDEDLSRSFEVDTGFETSSDYGASAHSQGGQGAGNQVGIDIPDASKIDELVVRSNAIGRLRAEEGAYDSAATGIRARSGSLDAEISGNRFRDRRCEGGGRPGSGSFQPFTCQTVTSKSTETPNIDCHLDVAGVTGLTVSENEFNAGARGVCIDDSTRLTFTDNKFFKPGTSGIWIKKSNGLDFRRGEVSESHEKGIHIVASRNIGFDRYFVEKSGEVGVDIEKPPEKPGVTILGQQKGTLVDPEHRTVALPEQNQVTPRKPAHPGPHQIGLNVFDNEGPGIRIRDGAGPIRIEGATTCANKGPGIEIDGAGDDISVWGSWIGISPTAPHPTTEWGNEGPGIRVQNTDAPIVLGHDAVVKQSDGPNRNLGNVIGANGGAGITLESSNQVEIQSSYIGTNPSAEIALANARAGIKLGPEARAIIGGKNSGNLISGNKSHGIELEQGEITAESGFDRTLIKNNAIGFGKDGSTALPNQKHGVRVDSCEAESASIRIKDNSIGHNTGSGVSIADCQAASVGISNSNIGETGADTAAPNGGDGVTVTNSARIFVADSNIAQNSGRGITFTGTWDSGIQNNTVQANTGGGLALTGGANSNAVVTNTVYQNQGSGITVTGWGSHANTLSQNKIYGHSGKAIALNGGGNDRIEAPKITSVAPREVAGKQRWFIHGSVEPILPSGSTVELFADKPGNISQGDEARRYLGQTQTVGSQFFFRNVESPIDLSLDGVTVSATVTDASGNTSELGRKASRDFDQPNCSMPAPPEQVSSAGFERRLVSIQSNGVASTKLSGSDSKTVTSVSDLNELDVCGSEIAYSAGSGDSAEIAVYDTDSESTTSITDNAAADLAPAFGPKCDKIAFASNRGGSHDIYLYDRSSENISQMTDTDRDERHPDLGPEGEKLVWSAPKPGGSDASIWTTTLGKDDIRLLFETEGDARWPDLAPGGKTAAFADCSEGTCNIGVGNLETDETAVWQHTTECDTRRPEWISGTGSQPLLAVDRAKDGATHVLLTNPLGRALWRVTPEETDNRDSACCLR